MPNLSVTVTSCSPKMPAVSLPPVNTMRIMGSGNSGLDPVFGGGLDKTSTKSPLQYYLNALTGQTAEYIYNATVAGSPMAWRLENANEARDNPSSANLLFITGQSGDGMRYPAGHDDPLLGWCQKYWAVGADVVVHSAQLSRNFANSADQSWDSWPAKSIAVYEHAIQHCNARLPAGRQPVRFLPISLIMERIRIDTMMGRAPASTTGSPTEVDYFNDLYNIPSLDGESIDAFHIGARPAASFIHSAASAVFLTGVQPKNLPSITNNGVALDAGEALYLKRVIHDVLSTYWLTGLDTSAWVRP